MSECTNVNQHLYCIITLALEETNCTTRQRIATTVNNWIPIL